MQVSSLAGLAQVDLMACHPVAGLECSWGNPGCRSDTPTARRAAAVDYLRLACLLRITGVCEKAVAKPVRRAARERTPR